MQQEKKEVRSRDIWVMLQKRRSNKDNARKIVLDQLIYLEDQLSPGLISFCAFQGWKNRKILAFRDFFAGNNFPNSTKICKIRKN